MSEAVAQKAPSSGGGFFSNLLKSDGGPKSETTPGELTGTVILCYGFITAYAAPR